MGFLPWEKWLPAWLLGPLMCIGSLVLLVISRERSWWEYIVFPVCSLLGAAQTWVWFKTGRNILNEDAPFRLTGPHVEDEKGRSS